MTRPIPDRIKRTFKPELCFICKQGATERHHSLIYSGRQINEVYCIIPLCTHCHRGENGTISQEVRKRCEYESVKNGIEHLKKNYPKRNWEQELKHLSSIYGKGAKEN